MTNSYSGNGPDGDGRNQWGNDNWNQPGGSNPEPENPGPDSAAPWLADEDGIQPGQPPQWQRVEDVVPAPIRHEDLPDPFAASSFGVSADGHGSDGNASDGNGAGGYAAPGFSALGGFEDDREEEREFAQGDDEPDAYEGGNRLSLGDDDVRLPWLEGDDEYEEESGSGLGQGLLLGVLGLLALGLIVGGLFWALRGQSSHEQQAEGGIVAAPTEPYKTKPANPGGEVVAGTGDTSFAVAEGQSRDAQMAAKSGDAPVEAAKPGFASLDKPGAASASPATSPVAAASVATATSGPGLQVGAYTSRETAEAGWATLQRRHASLSGVAHRVVQGQADFGTVFRLQAVPGDLAATRSLQAKLKAEGVESTVKP